MSINISKTIPLQANAARALNNRLSAIPYLYQLWNGIEHKRIGVYSVLSPSALSKNFTIGVLDSNTI